MFNENVEHDLQLDIKGSSFVRSKDETLLGKNAQIKLNEISKEAKEQWKNLMDLFKPYQP